MPPPITTDRKELLKLVREGISKKNFAESLKYCGKLVQIDPNDAIALIFTGFCFQKTGEFEKAEKAYRRVIEIAPNEPNYEAWLGLQEIIQEVDIKKAETTKKSENAEEQRNDEENQNKTSSSETEIVKKLEILEKILSYLMNNDDFVQKFVIQKKKTKSLEYVNLQSKIISIFQENAPLFPDLKFDSKLKSVIEASISQFLDKKTLPIPNPSSQQETEEERQKILKFLVFSCFEPILVLLDNEEESKVDSRVEIHKKQYFETLTEKFKKKETQSRGGSGKISENELDQIVKPMIDQEKNNFEQSLKQQLESPELYEDYKEIKLYRSWKQVSLQEIQSEDTEWLSMTEKMINFILEENSKVQQETNFRISCSEHILIDRIKRILRKKTTQENLIEELHKILLIHPNSLFGLKYLLLCCESLEKEDENVVPEWKKQQIESKLLKLYPNEAISVCIDIKNKFLTKSKSDLLNVTETGEILAIVLENDLEEALLSHKNDSKMEEFEKESSFVEYWIILSRLAMTQGLFKKMVSQLTKCNNLIEYKQGTLSPSFKVSERLQNEVKMLHAFHLSLSEPSKISNLEESEKIFKDLLTSAYAKSNIDFQVDCLKGLADVFMSKKQFENCFKVYNRLVQFLMKENPDVLLSHDPEIYLQFGWCHFLLFEQNHENQSLLADSFEYISKSFECFSKRNEKNLIPAHFHYKLGRILWEQQNFEESQQQFLISARKDPSFSKNFLFLGKYFEIVAKNSERAWKCYEKAIYCDPIEEEHTIGHRYHEFMISIGQSQQLIEFYTKIIEKFSHAKWILKYCGLFFHSRSNYELSKQYLQKLLRLDFQNQDFEAWEVLGLCYKREGKLTAALKCFERAIEIDSAINQKSSTTLSLIEMGNVHLLTCQFFEAKSCFQKAISSISDKKSTLGVLALFGLINTHFQLAKKGLKNGWFIESVKNAFKAFSIFKEFELLDQKNQNLKEESLLLRLFGEISLFFVNFCDNFLKGQAEKPDLISDTQKKYIFTERLPYLSNAMDCFEKCLQISEGNENETEILQYSKSIASFFMFKLLFLAQDNKELAEKHKNHAKNGFLQLLKLSPTNWDYWIGLGCILAMSEPQDLKNDHKIHKAMTCFLHAIRCCELIHSESVKTSTLSTIWCNLGFCFMKLTQNSSENLENLQKTCQYCFKIAQNLSPGRAFPWIGLGLVQELQNCEFGAASDCYKQVNILLADESNLNMVSSSNGYDFMSFEKWISFLMGYLNSQLQQNNSSSRHEAITKGEISISLIQDLVSQQENTMFLLNATALLQEFERDLESSAQNFKKLINLLKNSQQNGQKTKDFGLISPITTKLSKNDKEVDKMCFVLMNYGRTLFKQGKYELSAKIFQNILSSFKDFFEGKSESRLLSLDSEIIVTQGLILSLLKSNSQNFEEMIQPHLVRLTYLIKSVSNLQIFEENQTKRDEIIQRMFLFVAGVFINQGKGPEAEKIISRIEKTDFWMAERFRIPLMASLLKEESNSLTRVEENVRNSKILTKSEVLEIMQTKADTELMFSHPEKALRTILSMIHFNSHSNDAESLKIWNFFASFLIENSNSSSLEKMFPNSKASYNSMLYEFFPLLATSLFGIQQICSALHLVSDETEFNLARIYWFLGQNWGELKPNQKNVLNFKNEEECFEKADILVQKIIHRSPEKRIGFWQIWKGLKQKPE